MLVPSHEHISSQEELVLLCHSLRPQAFGEKILFKCQDLYWVLSTALAIYASVKGQRSVLPLALSRSRPAVNAGNTTAAVWNKKAVSSTKIINWDLHSLLSHHFNHQHNSDKTGIYIWCKLADLCISPSGSPRKLVPCGAKRRALAFCIGHLGQTAWKCRECTSNHVRHQPANLRKDSVVTAGSEQAMFFPHCDLRSFRRNFRERNTLMSW